MRIRQATSTALLGAALAFPALAQIAAPNPSGAAPRGPQVAYVIDIAGKTGLLLGVDGLPPIGSSASGSAKAPAGPALGSPMPATLMLHAGLGLPAEFYKWATPAINGSAPRTTLGVRGVDTGGHNGQVALFSDASVTYVQIPALDTRSNASITLNVKTQGVLRMEDPGKAPTLQQVSQLATRLGATRWLVSGFHVTVGKLNTGGVRRVETFTLEPGGALTLVLTTDDITAQAFATIAPKPPVKGQPKPLPPPALDGQLQLATANGQVMVSIALHDVQVTNIGRAATQDPSSGALVAANRVTLAAKQARVTFAPAIAQ